VTASSAAESEDRDHIEGRIAALKERREATYDYIQSKSVELETILAAVA
jgi:hypothetical protein